MILSWRPGNLIILSCAPLPSKPKMQERRCKYADNSSKLSAFFENLSNADAMPNILVIVIQYTSKI